MALGQEFIAGFQKPEGFCDWAWTDVSRMVLALLTGASFDRGNFKDWMKDGNSAVACCTDGFRPVTFKLERIDTKQLIDASGVERPAPLEAYDSERWGEFSYDFKDLSPGTIYRLRLHFCEVYHNGPGKRRFDVDAGAKRILSDFDVLAEANGKYKAIVKEFELAADAKGCLSLVFKKGAEDYPKLSAIEIIPASAGSAGKPVLAINAGGGACEGYAADSFFTGGNAMG
jgi:uncharacterized repeat protein (TIGR04076 family)